MQVQSVFDKIKQFNKYLQSNLLLDYKSLLFQSNASLCLLENMRSVVHCPTDVLQYKFKTKGMIQNYITGAEIKGVPPQIVSQKLKTKGVALHYNIETESQRNHVEIYINSH